ncbi:DUF3307 domain-containing protein [Pleomorphomonas sp. NRK KF1]|uniref:DUF3307 domain-containing protein n=1 Tax=Pleomorphomonas sp. NRK KF1 TaxID=2943000 RepID=UPI002043129B|nr:DUF3307 domain-containing protein [Pleomorphomonas sp. NRK KF1]MCM5552904.1 DUF3307 domain-containing protein [Pleomorphomonas sp. NRK KF1]
MMTDGFLVSLALLIFGHALGDYPLQTDFMARGKNWKTPVPGVPWYYLLGAHSIVHGGLAGLATGSLLVGILETAAHFLIDSLKNSGIISIHADQALHIACKVVWVAMMVGGLI